MVFAEFINWAIEQSGVTNYKLAKRLKVSQTTIANWCNGITEPRKRQRAEILEVFGVNEHDLEQGFPPIYYRESKQTEKLPAQYGEQDAEVQELIRLFDLASPELRAAALAVLKSAEAAQKAQDGAEEGK